jgi:hypothetical protein
VKAEEAKKKAEEAIKKAEADANQLKMSIADAKTVEDRK